MPSGRIALAALGVAALTAACRSRSEAPASDGAAAPPSGIAPAASHAGAHRKLPTPDKALMAPALDAGVRLEPPSTYVVGTWARSVVCSAGGGVEVRFIVCAVDAGIGCEHGPGVGLFGVRPTSLPGRLGIENGDHLLTVDGAVLDSSDAIADAVDRLCSEHESTLQLLRRDLGTVELRWRFVDGD